MLRSICLALLMAAPAVAKPPTMAPPTDDASLLAFIEGDGCHWASKTHVACIDAPVEMGFVTIALTLYTAGKPDAAERIVLYRDGSTAFEAKKVVHTGWTAAKTRLKGFVATTREKVAVKDGQVSVPGHRAKAPVVTSKDPQTRNCCAWTPVRGHRTPQTKAVEFTIDCRFTGDPARKADACFIEGYNDESLPTGRRVVVFP